MPWSRHRVDRDKGPGLLKSIYGLSKASMNGALPGNWRCAASCANAKELTVRYKQFSREEPLRFELLYEK